MAPATISRDGVLISLDEHTLAVAREAAREAVREHMATCPIVAEFRAMHSDMYGVSGEKDKHPGLLGRVADLERSRGLLRLGLWGVWIVITIFLGAVASRVVGSY